MPRMALSVTYDGAGWQGWQTQTRGKTLQQAFEAAATQFLNHPVASICAGRTDAGVHALSQVLHLDTHAVRSTQAWIRGMNALLPSNMAVQWVTPVTENFHARFSALTRTYVYVVRNAPIRSPMTHARVGWVYQPLCLEPMREAAAHLMGEHDFSSFRSSQCQAVSPVRNLHCLQIAQAGDFYWFYLKANAFLHHMVRNLVGALLYVGMGRQPPTWIPQLLQQRDRRCAAPTFSAAGLYLAQITYPKTFALPHQDWRTCFTNLTGMHAPHLKANP